MEKRLYRSRTQRVVAGVCGGLGAYFNVDPVLIRVLAVILAFVSFGTAVLLYVVMAFLIPLEPETPGGQTTPRSGSGSGAA